MSINGAVGKTAQGSNLMGMIKKLLCLALVIIILTCINAASFNVGVSYAAEPGDDSKISHDLVGATIASDGALPDQTLLGTQSIGTLKTGTSTLQLPEKAKEIAPFPDGVTDAETLKSYLPSLSASNASDYYFYFQLTDIEKVMYWKMAQATQDSPTIELSGLSDEDRATLEKWNRWASALSADQPRYHMIWSDSYTASSENDVLYITLDRNAVSTDYRINKSDARIRQIVSNVGSESDSYVKYRKLATFIARDMVYGSSSTGMDSSAFGCMLNNYAICTGFSDTLKILCDELNLPCVTIGNAGHAWNVVMIDGRWYMTDASDYSNFNSFASDPSDLDEISELLENGGILAMGYEGPGFTGNPNYHLSDYYHGNEGDFTFPQAEKSDYRFNGVYNVTYGDYPLDFEEPALTLLYSVSEDGTHCTITGYEGADAGNLVIPDTLDGYIVEAIGNGAFQSSHFGDTLTVGSNVKAIGESAFGSCENIKKVLLPSGLEEIGQFAFASSGISGKLSIPTSVKVIGNQAFQSCKGLIGTVSLPNGLEYLGVGAFQFCSGIGGMFYIPDNAEVGADFAGGTGVSSFSVSAANARYKAVDGLLYTKDMTTFMACPPAKKGSLVIPEGVQFIGVSACASCTGLNGTLSLPKTLREIHGSAFFNCSFVGDLVIPNTVTRIDRMAFSAAFDSEKSGKLVLSSSLVELGENAFSGCGFKGDLTIPDGVKDIPEDSFLSCEFGGKLTLGKNVRSIGEFAFYTCTFSNSIDLSKSKIKLDEYAFSGSYFSHFSCNCGKGMEKISYSQCDNVYECPHCHGAYRVISHEWSAWSITVQPTVKKVGAKERVCARCGEVEKQTIPRLEESPSEVSIGKGIARSHRLAGDTALDTMARIVGEGGFPVGGTVVLSTSAGYWDALTAAGIAGKVDAPVLMTDGKSLSPQTRSLIQKLKPTRIIICGGKLAVTDNVENQAKAAAGGNVRVVRCAGDTATGTACKIFEEGKKFGVWSSTAFVCTNDGYWDALAAAPISYANGMPIFLTEGKNSISAETLKTMKRGGVSFVFIVGGTAAVSDNVRAQLQANGVRVLGRFAGADAIETSELVAEFGVGSMQMSSNWMGVATTDGYWDALAGAALCGRKGSVLVLANGPKADSVTNFMNTRASSIADFYIFGGTAAVSKATENAAVNAAK